MPRRSFDGNKLAGDVSRLGAVDSASPPQAHPSLMDAVCAFAGFIEVRASLGWPDPMIAALLTEAGYPIDAATFRSYCKRLRDQGLLKPRPASQRRVPVVSSLLGELPAVEQLSADPARAETKKPDSDVASARAASVDNVAPRAPPGLDPPSRRSFSIDPAKLPLDRA